MRWAYAPMSRSSGKPMATLVDLSCGAGWLKSGALEKNQRRVPLKVVGGFTQDRGVIAEHAQTGVAPAAQDSPDHSALVTVIHRGAPDSARTRNRLGRTANLADVSYDAEGDPASHFILIVTATPVISVAGAAPGSECRGSRLAAVGVGFGEFDPAVTAMRRRLSWHGAILPAGMPKHLHFNTGKSNPSASVANWLGRQIAAVL